MLTKSTFSAIRRLLHDALFLRKIHEVRYQLYVN